MMPSDEQLIVRPGMKPAKSKRIRWYTDPSFRRLVHDAPDVPLLNVQIADDNGSIRLPVVPQGQPSLVLPALSVPPSTPENREVASRPQNQAPFDAERQPHAALAQAQSSETWRAESDLDYWASQVLEGWATFDDALAFAFQQRLARAKAAGSQEIDHDLIAKKAMDDVVQAIGSYERHKKRSC